MVHTFSRVFQTANHPISQDLSTVITLETTLDTYKDSFLSINQDGLQRMVTKTKCER